MKQIVKAFVMLLLMFNSFQIFGQTQADMNQESLNNFFKVDKELNDVYNKILKEYKSDIEFIKNFKNAQRIWIQFRDAELKAKYPDREDGYYGSVQPLCVRLYLTELTEERIKKLKIWLSGIEEGDACAGSIKMK